MVLQSYLGFKTAQQEWTMPIHHWKLAVPQLALHFEGRLVHIIQL